MFPWLKRRPPTPRTKPAWIDRLFKRRSTASSPPARPGASLPPATSGGLLNPAPQGPDLLPLVIFEAGDFFVPGVLPEEPSTRLVQSMAEARQPPSSTQPAVCSSPRGATTPTGPNLAALATSTPVAPTTTLATESPRVSTPTLPVESNSASVCCSPTATSTPTGSTSTAAAGSTLESVAATPPGRVTGSDSLGGLYLYTQGWVNKGGFPPGTTIKHVPNLSVAVPTENRSLPTLPASSSTQAAATPTTAASDPFAGFEYKWVPHSSIHVDSKNVILGEGQATVRLGEMLLEGVWTSVALKFMPLSEGRQFRKELELISLLNELNVPGIVKLFGAARDFATSEGRFHLLVLARANGKDLGPKNNKEVSEATTKGDPGWLPFNWSLALDRMVSLLETLVGLERLGIGHFDVKPDNLLLAENGSKDVILCDFGTAKPCKIGGTLPAGTVAAGTPGYRSPELLRLESYGAKADVFAAGATFYFLVERKNLFVGGSSPEQSLMTLRGVNVSTAFASDKWKKGFWAPRIAALIMGMVNPDPDDRLSLSAALSAASFLRSRIFKEPRWWDRRVKTEARRKVQDLRLPTSDQRLPDWVIDQFKECAAEGAELPALTDRELDGRVLSPAPAGQEPTTPRAGPAEQPVEAAKSSPRPLDGAALPTIRLVPPTPPRSTATTIPQLGATQGPLADQSSSTPASQPVVDGAAPPTPRPATSRSTAKLTRRRSSRAPTTASGPGTRAALLGTPAARPVDPVQVDGATTTPRLGSTLRPPKANPATRRVRPEALAGPRADSDAIMAPRLGATAGDTVGPPKVNPATRRVRPEALAGPRADSDAIMAPRLGATPGDTLDPATRRVRPAALTGPRQADTDAIMAPRLGSTPRLTATIARRSSAQQSTRIDTPSSEPQGAKSTPRPGTDTLRPLKVNPAARRDRPSAPTGPRKADRAVRTAQRPASSTAPPTTAAGKPISHPRPLAPKTTPGQGSRVARQPGTFFPAASTRRPLSLVGGPARQRGESRPSLVESAAPLPTRGQRILNSVAAIFRGLAPRRRRVPPDRPST